MKHLDILKISANFDDLEQSQVKGVKRTLTIGENKFNLRKGLTAPPYLDWVWTSLLKYKSYSRFWNEIFGCYLERPHSIDCEPDRLFNYDQTLNCLKDQWRLIKPLKNLWPDYKKTYHDNPRNTDNEYFVSLTYAEISQFKKDIAKSYEEHKSFDHSIITSLCEEMREKLAKVHQNKVTKQSNTKFR